MMMIRSNNDGATMTIRSMILRTMTMVLLVMRWCDAFNNAIGNAMVRLIMQWCDAIGNAMVRLILQ
jgi:hypothetical protein